ncbi:UNVERIFIED_CONTAM: Protein DEFECTIVE IN MERISTEM SILENCING 3 [Sesamum indicum]
MGFRLFSEHLGLETMLAVVCKTYEGVKALEAYNKEGSIDKNSGLHAFAASIGRPLADRFLVICLEDIRPYSGEIIADDPQRRLTLLKPRLLNGEHPPGFLGFAVNMITIDSTNLYCFSKNGHSLRETLFYHLFSDLQVYKSREDMLNALSCIRNGAISLDGGMIRSRGVFSLGHHQGDIDVKFPTTSQKLNLPESYFGIEVGLKEMKWKKDRTMEDMQREQALLAHARVNYETKKREFLQFLARSSSHVSQAELFRLYVVSVSGGTRINTKMIPWRQNSRGNWRSLIYLPTDFTFYSSLGSRWPECTIWFTLKTCFSNEIVERFY